MRTQPLTRTASVTLDGSGAGTAAIGPRITNEIWTVGVASVSASANVNEATCRIYAGSAAGPGTFIDGTTWGSTGDATSNFSGPLYGGQQVFAAWSGGDPGAIATLVITGTRQVP
jgi:hypothetical protein